VGERRLVLSLYFNGGPERKKKKGQKGNENEEKEKNTAVKINEREGKCMWKSEQNFVWLYPASFEIGFVRNCSISTKSFRINKKRKWRGEPFLSLIRYLLNQI